MKIQVKTLFIVLIIIPCMVLLASCGRGDTSPKIATPKETAEALKNHYGITSPLPEITGTLAYSTIGRPYDRKVPSIDLVWEDSDEDGMDAIIAWLEGEGWSITWPKGTDYTLDHDPAVLICSLAEVAEEFWNNPKVHIIFFKDTYTSPPGTSYQYGPKGRLIVSFMYNYKDW